MASESFSEVSNPAASRDDVDNQIAVISKELEQMRSRLSAAPDTSVIGQLQPMTEQLKLISRKLDGIDQHLRALSVRRWDYNLLRVVTNRLQLANSLRIVTTSLGLASRLLIRARCQGVSMNWS